MNQDKNRPTQTSPHSAWEQISGIVGNEFLSKLEPDSRVGLQNLIEHAYQFGRIPHGPVREIQTLIGDRWSALLLLVLNFGAIRFSTLQRITAVLDQTGISRRMLSFTLRTLERNGLVTRTVLASVPPNVEYALTPLGHELANRVSDFLEWLTAQWDDIEIARAAYEQKHGSNIGNAALPDTDTGQDV